LLISDVGGSVDNVIAVLPYTMVIIVEMVNEFGYPVAVKKLWFGCEGFI